MEPEPIAVADMLLVESTYGDRVHPADATDRLARIVTDAARRGGVLIIPAFAVGRTQELLWTLRALEEQQRIPPLPVFIDSPMAANVTEIYWRHRAEHDPDMRSIAVDNRSPLATSQTRFVRTMAESKALNDRSGPMIVIAGSGMATGGRVIHHLKLRLPDDHTTVLLAGYQAAGTRGRSLQEGAREIRIHGESVPVRARVELLDGLSAHADREEILRWLSGFRKPPRETWVVHGEPGPAAALASEINRRLGWNSVRVAEDGATVALAS